MMVVVSDTTAITNLIQIKLLIVIKNIFGQIIVPQAVYDELVKFSNQRDIIQKQAWIIVKKVTNQELYSEIANVLDKGEAEAITLAIEMNANVLVIDELAGRKIAEKYGLRIIGLLGILVIAKQRGLIPAVRPYMDQLKNKIGFRIKPKLYNQILRQVNEDK